MTGEQTLVFSKNENLLIASILSSSERQPIDLDGLHELLVQAGYSHWFLFSEALTSLIEQYNSPVTEFSIPIGECRDAGLNLEISSDALEVWGSLVPACGGNALNSETVYQIVDEAGVTFGIDRDAVNALCAASSGDRVLRIRVAKGIPAVNGEDTRFELLVDDVRDRAPRVDENGLINFRELGAIPMVVADQPLMRRIPPTLGAAGRNVRGEILDPLAGRNEAFAEGMVGAYVDNDDKNLLRASFSGQPVRCGNGVKVEKILHMRGINMATGNVTFDGTVNIEGEVQPGMKVSATGDVIVGYVVDGGELDAGGDVCIAGGVIAKAKIRAAGSVSARFVENAHISAGMDIAIDDTSLQSDLQANNQILVGLKSTSLGRLAGGSVRTTMLIQAPILGSPTVGVTKLVLGVNPVLDAKHQDLLKQIEQQRETEDKLGKLVKLFTKQGDKPELLERAKASWHASLQSWAKLMQEKEVLEKEMDLVAQAKVRVGRGVEGAVDMNLVGKVLHLRKNYEPGEFSLNDDQVVFTDSAGNVRSVG